MSAEGEQAFLPAVTPPILSGMENFRKAQTLEEKSSLPFTGLPPGLVEMKVKEGSKIRNLMGFAMARMGTEGTRQIVFSGCGRAVTKVITCVEILKRKLPGLHQVTKVHYKSLEEVWEKKDLCQEARVERLTVYKNVPSISILLSKDPLDPREVGYQPPEPRADIWTLGSHTATNTSPKREKRHEECPSQARVKKLMKVEDNPLSHFSLNYMLSCYP